jgi:light-regulated signal transduction histidine kinase (bacteriophytochrome)
VNTDAEQCRLQSHNIALEALVAERTRELAATVEELEAFTYSVAHDLRAPLRAINSFSRILAEDYADRFQDEASDYLQRISRASEQMSRLIDDLLKLSHIGRGEIEREVVNLSALVIEIGARLAETEPERDVRLDVEKDITVVGDARLLSIAFENLLANSRKFTRRREIALIKVATTPRHGKNFISITDNGTGFDMRYRHKLFAPFQRLHSAKEFEGTGIGLVTVSRIIARHGGEISIEGVQGFGTTVSVYIPDEA